MLHTEPSFSVYADGEGLIDIKKDDLKAKTDSGEFSFAKTIMELSEFENLGDVEKEEEQVEPVSFNGDVEENYKRMVDEDPSNPLFLKNYAQILQSKGDLNGAEEYYFRATIADPKDGEILMQYAKLVWELHRDQDLALGYFESAVLAAPDDSYILAAYASFLWEIDDDEENEANALVEESSTGVEVDIVDLSSDELEEYYKKMVNEKCCDPLLLRNYARFLQQKGDLERAEEYYSRAVQADPKDGEVISQYAHLVWELHHDQDKASDYFKQAVETAPTNSHVLAAYAKFLWEAEDEDDE